MRIDFGADLFTVAAGEIYDPDAILVLSPSGDVFARFPVPPGEPTGTRAKLAAKLAAAVAAALNRGALN